jgi:hypothetical protein
MTSAGWSRRVVIATNFVERWRGLRRSSTDAMLISTRSVHGLGMDRPLLAVGLDADYRVIGWRVLSPNRIIGLKGARHWLELPVDDEPPPIGSFLEVTHV